MSANKQTFESDEIVAFYRSYEALQKPEQAILRMIQPAITGGQVLDIGIGGGRTTPALCAKARKYVGIDYSEKMIAVCKERFSNAPRSVSFFVCDARDMRRFTDGIFDVVMFSFNGLDYMSHEDRLVALREIRRLCAPDGWFIFSTHNLWCVERLFSYRQVLDRCKGRLWRFPLEVVVNHQRRLLNPGFQRLHMREYAILNDGVHGFRLNTYYVKPLYQIEQLHRVGFANVKVFSLSRGLEIEVTELDKNRDPWLYFTCRPRA